MIYKKGDFIGQKYEVYDVLGEGGFGIVYLVYSHETKSPYALKTFRDEYLEDATTRERFKKEAQVWIDLERHPYLVRAHFVDEISGRLYIAMEHIASDEQGLNSLDIYLRRKPPDLAQTLRWAIQFCHGMEYAYSKGIRAHRDIKPSNIMIDQNKNVKISDFGLAGIFQTNEQSVAVTKTKNNVAIQTMAGTSIGTPEYMSPEQFTDFSACDERSDIYSFGVVLYQMASGGKLPFYADNPDYRWSALKHLHQELPVPKLNSLLFPIIQRCLEKEPKRRYQTFSQLRAELEVILKRETGETIKLQEQQELDWWEWGNKGNSLHRLGLYDNAIQCFNKALELNVNDNRSWNNKGLTLRALGRFNEAIACLEKALRFSPSDTGTLNNKGICLDSLGFFKDAIYCYDTAVPLTGELLDMALNLMAQEIPYIAEQVRSFYDIAVKDSATSLPGTANLISNFCTLLEYNELREHGGGERWSSGGSQEKLALKFYLAKALTMRTPSSNEVPALYLKFAQQLRKEDVLLSFNWDCLLEAALEKAGLAYSYEGYRDGHIFIAKLHGSAHWRLRQFTETNKYSWQRIGFDTFEDIPPLFVSNNLRNPRAWHYRELFGEIEPFLVLPGFGKAYDVRLIAPLWYKPEMAFFLRKNIFIIGLSLAPDDFFIRSFFLNNLPHVVGKKEGNLTIINSDRYIERNFHFVGRSESTTFITEPFSEKHVEAMAES